MSAIRIILTCVICLCFFSISVQAEEMSISQAYRALPHQRTQFNASHAKMGVLESKYLDHLFFVTDLAFRERMLMLRAFQVGQDHRYIETYNKEIGNLLGSFEFIEPPTRVLGQVEKLVIESVREQRAFFNIWYKARGTQQYKNWQRNVASHKYVQSSHQKLIQAYSVLKQNYPQEIPHNQQSFYDHLCALDFL
ncbi:MAG: hypothetical protein COB36_06300 [Alphaproteobacteria bacterium]|nr:MAG: hypothetical protein COB36_06300 [Alphaproteobacteria bacterium]